MVRSLPKAWTTAACIVVIDLSFWLYPNGLRWLYPKGLRFGIGA
jgi:hypothetical protein